MLIHLLRARSSDQRARLRSCAAVDTSASDRVISHLSSHGVWSWDRGAILAHWPVSSSSCPACGPGPRPRARTVPVAQHVEDAAVITVPRHRSYAHLPLTTQCHSRPDLHAPVRFPRQQCKRQRPRWAPLNGYCGYWGQSPFSAHVLLPGSRPLWNAGTVTIYGVSKTETVLYFPVSTAGRQPT